MNLIDTKDVKWIEPPVEEIKKVSAKIEKMDLSALDEKEVVSTDSESGFSKMKAFIRKAVNCCIE